MLPWLAPGGEILLFMVSRSLENAFEAIVHLTMLSNIDVYTKSQPQSPCSFMQISLYIILLTRNSMASKIAFPWSLLHLEFIVWKFPAIIVVILYLCTQKDIPWCVKSMLNSNFITFVPRKSAPIHGFWIFASSNLMVFVILPENDDFLSC